MKAVQNSDSHEQPLENGGKGFLRILWDFLASIKLTVILLLVLAGVSGIGTVIPQNKEPADYVRAFGEFNYTLFSVLDLFDMYRAWWFQLLMVLLTANIVVCSVKRFPSTWRFVFSGKTGGKFSGKDSYTEEFADSRSPFELEPLYEKYLSKKFSARRIERTENGFGIVAEKGRWTKLGVYVVHLSIVLMLAGSLAGSMFGFDGYVNIPEGESVNRISLRNTNETMMLDFDIRCDKFKVEFYETGEPKEYRSSLSILEAGKTVLKKDIVVNHPLSYKGIDIFQSSYGAIDPKGAVLVLNNPKTMDTHTIEAPMGRVVELPGKSGSIVLREFHPRFGFGGRSLGETFAGQIQPAGGKPQEITLPVNYPNFDRMRRGDWVVTVLNSDRRFYTGLQVAWDPGVPVVYAGFIAIIAGCIITFFAGRAKIMVKVTGTGTVQVTGGTGKGSQPGIERLVNGISKALSKL